METEKRDTAESNEFFSTVEAAAYVGYSLTWVKKLYYKGELPGRRLGHDLLFTKAALDAFLEKRGRGPGEPALTRGEAAAYVGLSGPMFHWWSYHEDPEKRVQPTGKRGRQHVWTKAALDAWKTRVLDNAPSTQKRRGSQP